GCSPISGFPSVRRMTFHSESATVAASAPTTLERYLIVNADDFGASTGINRGILACHTDGVVSSASLMVTGRAVSDAVSLSRDHPGLAIGLHWDVWGEDE